MQALKVKAYAATAALTAESTVTDTGAKYHTVSLDVASGSVPKYDWAKKLNVRLTEAELPVFLGVLLGWVPKQQAFHHGPHKDKGFEVEHQGVRVFFKISQKDNGVRVMPIEGADLLALSGLVMHQLLQNMPWMTPDSLLTLVKNTIGRAAHAAALQKAG